MLESCNSLELTILPPHVETDSAVARGACAELRTCAATCARYGAENARASSGFAVGARGGAVFRCEPHDARSGSAAADLAGGRPAGVASPVRRSQTTRRE